MGGGGGNGNGKGRVLRDAERVLYEDVAAVSELTIRLLVYGNIIRRQAIHSFFFLKVDQTQLTTKGNWIVCV